VLLSACSMLAVQFACHCAQRLTAYALPAAGIDPYDADATAPSELVCFTQAFHGRTLGALALTAKVRPRL